MADPVPDLPDTDALPSDRDVLGVYDYCGGEVLYCVTDTTTDGRWIAVQAGAEQPLEGWR